MIRNSIRAFYKGNLELYSCCSLTEPNQEALKRSGEGKSGKEEE
jgi:hypothetical protein